MLSHLAIKQNLNEAVVGRQSRAPSPEPVARLSRLGVTDFRSYRQAEIVFDGRPAAIHGPNGAGKTNLLEAISMLGPGRGLRRARLDELPRLEGKGGWAVSARLNDGEDERRFGIGVDASRPDRRICRIDNSTASGPGALTGHLRFMWLTPAQDRLFMDGASERRRFLDRMTLAHDPAHAKTSTSFEKAMRQRQKLLETRSSDNEWLSALEQQMAAAGVAIAAARCEMASRLAGATVANEPSPFPTARLALSGTLEGALCDTSPIDVEDNYADLLREQRRRDTEVGRALIGPHRSDLLVSHLEKDRPARLCSTGEQKALLIGLVLAGARALRAEKIEGAALILLLDEIAAHLDPDRRAALFTIINELGFQTFMTGTDKSLFSAWGDRAQHFEARDGALRETD